MSGAALNILLLEAYYGGSHRAFLDTLIRHSRHRHKLISLPARKWKWRMRGSAIWFAEQIRQGGQSDFDLILTSDMTDVADLRGLLPRRLRDTPIVTYFHENQLTYPIPDEDDRDYQYGFTNIVSAAASDAVWFNSGFHREAFLSAADWLIGKMPDYQPAGIVERLREKSRVVYPLVEGPPDQLVENVRVHQAGGGDRGPRILWSHRWEYDKNPEAFFAAMVQLVRDRRPFELVILGESFRQAPEVFAETRELLQPYVVHSGFVDSRDEYWRLVGGCDVVVSTVIQENFGIAVVEAMLAGCAALLPDRLSYPELIPSRYHGQCIYAGDMALVDRLAKWTAAGRELQGLASAMRARFSPTDARMSEIDDLMIHVASTPPAAWP